MKVSIIASDLSDNATGRADLLARLLAPRFEVEVVGVRFGDSVWPPVAGGPVLYRALAAPASPRLLGAVPALLKLVDGDVILASKPRPTSFGLGMLARHAGGRRRPLLLDVDDWEIGFFLRSGRRAALTQMFKLRHPNGLAWTWLMDRLIPEADALIVASRFLERRFGGVLVPHVRDTDAWTPERFDRAAARARLGLNGERVVMFLGTPWAYKGIDDLVEAVAGLPAGVRLILVGVRAGSGHARRWAGRPEVTLVDLVPFDEVPRYLIAADVVAVPQRDTPDTRGQLPAKLFDAMALGRPIVSTRVSMIPEILDGCGVVVPPGDVPALREGLRGLLADRDRATVLGQRARARCVEHYSFAAARRDLFPLIDDLTESRRHR
jgi:glycosyltransferase involved in cell wall biosynthesis